MAKRKVSERDFLIEQIIEDTRYNNGQINEGWLDSFKANVAGGLSGVKQGFKNTGRRIADAGRTIKQVGSNIKHGAKAAGNIALGNKDAAMQNVNNVKAATANNKGIDNTVKGAASSAKINSYSKSILNTVSSYIQAGGNVEELIANIRELAPAENKQDLSKEEMAGAQMTDDAIQNGAVMDSYNPYINASSQIKMLNSIQ